MAVRTKFASNCYNQHYSDNYLDLDFGIKWHKDNFKTSIENYLATLTRHNCTQVAFDTLHVPQATNF
jgi:hypothetical protein